MVISMKNNAQIFTDIYNSNGWGDIESISGPGSRIENTVNLRKELIYLVNKLNIKSILDVPCGDINWMSKVDLKNIRYYGFDIVKELIEQNKEKFKNKNYNFECKDAISDKLPQVDLILCRDLIIHFPIKEIWNLLNNFIKSGSKYLLISKSINQNTYNQNIEFGSWSPRNLEKPPFNFPKPLYLVLDHDNESHGCGAMGLYKISHLRCFIKNYFKFSNK